MAETPDTPEIPAPSPTLLREQALLENKTRWDEAAKAGGSPELMLEYATRDLQLRGLDVGTPTPEEGPRPHKDPALAALGYTEPEAHDPQAIEKALLLRRADDAPPLPSETVAFARALSEVLPPQLAYATVHLLEDLGKMEGEAEAIQYSEKLVQEALRKTWDRDYDRMDEYWQAAKAMLPKVASEYLDRFWLDNFPQARDRIARFFRDEFLRTPEGELWLLRPKKGGAGK